MNYDTALDYVSSKLEERRADTEHYIGRGTVKDYPEYQNLCGVIQGLDYAKQIISDLAHRLETHEDD